MFITTNPHNSSNNEPPSPPTTVSGSDSAAAAVAMGYQAGQSHQTGVLTHAAPSTASTPFQHIHSYHFLKLALARAERP